jgi:putative ABC transport system substrate-binding protein
MRRRAFIAGLGSAAAWPLAARAQQQSLPVIGFLHAGSVTPYAGSVEAFRQGLKESGYVEGQNVAVEYRWADTELERLPKMASDLVNRRVAVILSGGGAASALAAKAATSTIPIVVVFGSDPVQLGLVSSLSRPGGNVTGVTFLTAPLVAKRFDLLHQLVPHATTVAYLAGDQRVVVGREMLREVQAAAGVLGLQVVTAEARSDQDFESAFATFVERRADAVVVGSEPLFVSRRNKLIALAAHYKLPAIYQARDFALEGGLASYSASRDDAYHMGSRYVAQILRGAKPADLPVLQPTKFELVINLNTAKALGLTVPETLLATADEVIQ